MIKNPTLNDLVARYRFKPNSCHVYVEGNTDKHFIKWFLEQQGYRAAQDFDIFDSNDINISGEELKQRELVNNNRSRVIAVALEMQKEFKVMPKHLVCLADKDFDGLFGKEYPPCEGLLFSDYCDLEMYLFNEAVIDKFLHLVLSTSKISATPLLDSLSPVLEELFLIRATNQALQWGMTWLSFDAFKRCCELKQDNTTIQFDQDGFIDKYLHNSKKFSNKSCFLDKLEELRLSSNSLPDPRHKIRGHDFIEVLHWYLEHSVKIKRFNEEALGGSLLGCVELKQLKLEPLFKKLLARMPQLTKDV